ncbi:MAG: PorT family protein [Flavobacteriaceae bacterium]|nr:PorT family protein [Flavobacteriaceae bacterium]
MKNNILLLFSTFIITGAILAQDTEVATSEVDTKYREDQFYIGVTYNLLSDKPDGVDLRGVSGGISFGYLRDMPLNQQRNIAIALGAGLAIDQYGQNLFIGEDTNENTIFRALGSTVDFDTNRLSMATLEVPFEFRWRSSTATDYNFWRVYFGIKTGYVYWYRSNFKQPNNDVAQTDIPEFEQLRMGATLAFGYSTFNFYAYYSLNPFFKDAQTIDTQEEVSLKTIKLGIIFYIL